MRTTTHIETVQEEWPGQMNYQSALNALRSHRRAPTMPPGFFRPDGDGAQSRDKTLSELEGPGNA